MTEVQSRVEKKKVQPASKPKKPLKPAKFDMASYAEKKKEDLIVNLSVIFIILAVIFGGLYFGYTILPF